MARADHRRSAGVGVARGRLAALRMVEEKRCSPDRAASARYRPIRRAFEPTRAYGRPAQARVRSAATRPPSSSTRSSVMSSGAPLSAEPLEHSLDASWLSGADTTER